MKFALCLLFSSIVVISCPVFAEPLLVRSGEHNDFTRLVVSLPENANWTWERDQQRVVVRVENHMDGFDTNAVFKKIPKTRLTGVSQSTDELVLELKRNFEVGIFEEKGPYVVVDIKERELSASTEVKADLSETPEEVRMMEIGTPFERTVISEDQRNELSDAQFLLSRELAVAAMSGALAARKTISNRVSEIPLPSQFSRNMTSVKENLRGIDITNLRLRSSRDAAKSETITRGSVKLTDSKCVAEDEIALEEWGDDRPFHVQIGEKRQDLYRDLDKMDSLGARQLAKLYLYFGFGTEARAILALQGEYSGKDQLLFDLAQILDQEYVDDSMILHKMNSCDGDIALWSFLAQKEVGLGDEIFPNAILEALNKLPTHLRSTIAPIVAERFLVYGDVDASETALRTLARLTEPLTARAEYVTGKLAHEEGEMDIAVAKYESIIKKNSESAPAAIIALVESRFENEYPIDSALAELVETLLFEARGGAMEGPLMRSHIIALAGSGQLNAAFEAFKVARKETSDEESEELLNLLAKKLVSAADDITFLKHGLELKDAEFQKLSDLLALALSKRLLRLGFPEFSERVISAVPDRPIVNERQILAAEISMALGKPLKAIADLNEVGGGRATEIRAMAHELSGNLGSAHLLYLASGQNVDATRTAWLDEKWENEILLNDPTLGPIASFSLSQPFVDNIAEGMLERSEKALIESDIARAAITGLLVSEELLLVD